ncbi:ras and EF-hand domain-containing protein [Nilaparvata lugens]|uniref:ras and EF-hand domain-containing protein n=1 Tax=Nilaparvata lugens TaxID=108931 RepID=UPI00193EBF79|nr:ras and EF-hand domain-containing protein [Nilaparvata lugens]
MSESSKPSKSYCELNDIKLKTNSLDRKNKTKLSSLIRFSLKRTFSMSSKNKEVEKGGEDEPVTSTTTTTAKKGGKKGKKNALTKTKTIGKSEAGEGSPENKGSSSKAASMVRRLSLDKIVPKLKGKSREENGDGRRSTTPDIKEQTAAAVDLRQELEEAEKKRRDDLSVPKTSEESGDLSGDDYRTPVCQSPEGSVSDGRPPPDSAGSEASFESAIQTSKSSPESVRMERSVSDTETITPTDNLLDPLTDASYPVDPKLNQNSVTEKPAATVTSKPSSTQSKDRPKLEKSPSIRNSETQQALSDRRESLFKILVIGELGAGKTSIIKRYVHEFFSQNYRATIGVDFALKVLNWDQNTVVRLQLWDIAGQERFGNMTRVYYKEAVGALIVFDVTRAATFDAVLKWKQDLDSKVQLPDGSPIPCILLANKCDQPKEGIVNDKEKMNEYCKQNNFSDWFETSAKENINIDNAAKCLVEKILQNEKFNQKGDSQKDGNRVSLGGRGQAELQDGKKKFCC